MWIAECATSEATRMTTAEDVEDPDERQEPDHDLPPMVVKDEALQAQKQRRRETDVGGRDDQPHPPERMPERLPVRVL